MRIFEQKSGKGIRQLESLEQCDLQSCSLVWVDLEQPGEEELESIRDYFAVHPIVLDECQNISHLPKVQDFQQHLFVIWEFLRDDPSTERLETASVVILLGRNYLVTVRSEPVPEIENILSRLEEDPSRFHGQPALILYAIMDSAVDDYFPLADGLTESIDSFIDDLLAGQETGELKAILVLKHRNMALRRIVAAHRDVIIKLMRRDLPLIPEDLVVYLMDVFDHLNRISSQVDNNADLISSSLDIHLGTVSNRMNTTMKRLTTIATIFLPLTFLAGVYGMNFKFMPELSWRYGYVVIWLMFVVIVVVMVIIAIKKEWF